MDYVITGRLDPKSSVLAPNNAAYSWMCFVLWSDGYLRPKRLDHGSNHPSGSLPIRRRPR